MSKTFHLLAVDDDALILDLMHTACRPFISRVDLYTAISVHEAIDLSRRFRFDMVLLDHELEGVQGWQLLDYLRPFLNRSALALVYSSYVDDAAKAAYQERNVTEILAKPLTLTALGFAIRRALDI